MSEYKIIGIDLAKSVFQVCGLNQANKMMFNKKLTRAKFPEYIQQLPPCVIAMESCGSAQYWARRFIAMGHTVQLVPAQHVKAFVRGNKNDHNDALAICEAAQRPGIHFVPVKSPEQQDLQMLHRIRSQHVSQNTVLANQIRAYLRENGIIIPTAIQSLLRDIPDILADADNGLTFTARELIQHLYSELLHTRQQIKTFDQQLTQIILSLPAAQRLMSIPGIGPMVATALWSAIGNGMQFKNGRQLAAWLGLTPGHHSSADKTITLGMTKRGDAYLRMLIIHGARTVVRWCGRRDNGLTRWLQALIARRGKQKAIVALANKITRIAWVVLTREECYQASKACRSAT